MDTIKPIFLTIAQDKIVQALLCLVVMDVLFGILRAIKERSFNSTIGINGMIRKAGMLMSVVCMGFLDEIVHFDLIGFIPDAIKEYLPLGSVGVLEFFAVLYIIYECTSVLKNMALAGLPVEKVWKAVAHFLSENTDEIADVVDDEDGETDGNTDEPKA